MGVFADKIRLSNEKMLKKVQARSQKIVKAISNTIVDRTPVKTGRLKGGWSAEVDAIPTPYYNRFNPKGGIVKREISVKVARIPFNKDWVYRMDNDVHYGPLIEYDGWSKKAPDGMVRVTMTEVRSIIARIK